jgi:hypothetical protein
MTNINFKAFGDELLKIAMFQQLAKGFKDAVHQGWEGVGPEGSPMRSSWMGQGLPSHAAMATKGPVGRAVEHVTSLGGLTKKLPVGTKSLQVATTALQAPAAFAKEDPTGQGRTRAERVTGLAGNAVGGLAATGALLRSGWGKKHPIMANLVGGIGGGVAGEKILSAPFRPFRRPQPQPQQAAVPQQQGEQVIR